MRVRLAPALVLLTACKVAAPERTIDGYPSFQEIWNHPAVQAAVDEQWSRVVAAGYGYCSFDTLGSTPPVMTGTWDLAGQVSFSTVPSRVPFGDASAWLVVLDQSDGIIDAQLDGTSGSAFVTGHEQVTIKFQQGTRTFDQKEATLWFANHTTAPGCEQRSFSLITLWEYSILSIDTQPPPPGTPWKACGLTVVYESTCGGEGWFSWGGTASPL